jgi:hypothetical protein
MFSHERDPIDLILAYCRGRRVGARESFPLFALFLELDRQGLTARECASAVAQATELGLLDVAPDRPGYVILTQAGSARALLLPLPDP